METTAIMSANDLKEYANEILKKITRTAQYYPTDQALLDELNKQYKQVEALFKACGGTIQVIKVWQ